MRMWGDTGLIDGEIRLFSGVLGFVSRNIQGSISAKEPYLPINEQEYIGIYIDMEPCISTKDPCIFRSSSFCIQEYIGVYIR